MAVGSVDVAGSVFQNEALCETLRKVMLLMYRWKQLMPGLLRLYLCRSVSTLAQRLRHTPDRRQKVVSWKLAKYRSTHIPEGRTNADGVSEEEQELYTSSSKHIRS